MADLTAAPVLSAIATVNSKLSDLPVKDGQMIFVQDKNTIALDYGGKRVLYKQIDEISTEASRASMLAPVNGHYYFVVETGVMWTYRDGWVQITSTPSDIKNYADEIGKRVTGSVDDDGTLVITFNDQLWTAE